MTLVSWMRHKASPTSLTETIYEGSSQHEIDYSIIRGFDWVFAASDSSASAKAQADMTVSATGATATSDIQTILDLLNAGSRVLFRRGTYNLAEAGGSPGYALDISKNPMYLEGDGDDTVIQWSAEPTSDPAYLIHFQAKTGSRLKNMKLAGGAATEKGRAMSQVVGCTDVVCDNVLFEDFPYIAVGLGNASLYTCTRPKFLNNCRWNKCGIGLYAVRTIDCEMGSFTMTDCCIWGMMVEKSYDRTTDIDDSGTYNHGTGITPTLVKVISTAAIKAGDRVRIYDTNNAENGVVKSVDTTTTLTLMEALTNDYHEAQAAILYNLDGVTSSGWNIHDFLIDMGDHVTSWATGQATTISGTAITAGDDHAHVASIAGFVADPIASGFGGWYKFGTAALGNVEYRPCHATTGVLTIDTDWASVGTFLYNHSLAEPVVEIRRNEHGIYIQGEAHEIHSGEIRNAMAYGIRSCVAYPDKGNFHVHHVKVHGCMSGGMAYATPGDHHNLQHDHNDFWDNCKPATWYGNIDLRCPGILLAHDGYSEADPDKLEQRHSADHNTVIFDSQPLIDQQHGIKLHDVNYCMVDHNAMKGTMAYWQLERPISISGTGNAIINNFITQANLGIVDSGTETIIVDPWAE
jgi:hypothetical protein